MITRRRRVPTPVGWLVALTAAAGIVAVGLAAMVWSGDGDDDGRADPLGSGHVHDVGETGPHCPEAWDGPRARPTSTGERLTAPARKAYDALVARSIELPCGSVGGGHGGHGQGVDEVDLLAGEPTRTEEEQHRLAQQWAEAVQTARSLRTEEEVRAAGYRKSSGQIAGVGSHWVNWPMVDRPFDPASPSMVLLHAWPGQDQRLVGFSYWVRSAGGPPDGFAGPDDRWHRHLGLCFEDGWLLADDVPSPDHCGGDWVSGHDLWMLHAWVVPEEPSPNGPFSPTNPRLCPGDLVQIPDVLKCSQV